MLDSPRPYDICLDEDGDFPTYHFITQNGVEYTVYFVSAQNNGAAFTHAYFFNFTPDRDTTSIPLDVRIAHTLVKILQLFFKNQRHCAVYICDDQDDRAELRFRVFDYWFKQTNDTNIYKKDHYISEEKYTIFSSLLVHKDNPDLDEIVQAYDAYFCVD